MVFLVAWNTSTAVYSAWLFLSETVFLLSFWLNPIGIDVVTVTFCL